MKVAFRRSFLRDLKRIRQKNLLGRIQDVIEQVESAESLQDIGNLTSMRGASGFYRIRIGDHRIGIFIESDVVEFVRCLHRREIYRYFP